MPTLQISAGASISSPTEALTIGYESSIGLLVGIGPDVNSVIPAGESVTLKCPVVLADLLALYLYSDKDVTVADTDYNSTTLINLKAAFPLTWELESGYYDCPVKGDLTTIYVTNGGAQDARLTARFLLNEVPA